MVVYTSRFGCWSCYKLYYLEQNGYGGAFEKGKEHFYAIEIVSRTYENQTVEKRNVCMYVNEFITSRAIYISVTVTVRYVSIRHFRWNDCSLENFK